MMIRTTSSQGLRTSEFQNIGKGLVGKVRGDAAALMRFTKKYNDPMEFIVLNSKRRDQMAAGRAAVRPQGVPLVQKVLNVVKKYTAS